jgi:hypothetical protein
MLATEADMKNLITALALSLFAAPIAAQNVSSAEGDWSNIPELRKNRIVELSSGAQNMVEKVVAQGKCKAVGSKDRVNLALPFLVEFAPDNKVASIMVKRIGCPEVESIAASTALYAAQAGTFKPNGDNEAGWYRGEVSYILR